MILIISWIFCDRIYRICAYQGCEACKTYCFTVYIKIIIIQGIICTKLCRQVSGSWFTEIEHASNSCTHCNCNSLVSHYVRAYSDPIIYIVNHFCESISWHVPLELKYSVHTHLFYSLKFHDIVYTHLYCQLCYDIHSGNWYLSQSNSPPEIKCLGGTT